MENRRKILNTVRKEPEKVEHIEHIMGILGFTLLWTFDKDNPCSVECSVYRKITTGDDGPEYEISLNCYTKDIREATPDVRAYMKWDSCEHFWFGDEDGYMHLCGVADLREHIALIKHMYKKSFELMGKEPIGGEEWE